MSMARWRTATLVIASCATAAAAIAPLAAADPVWPVAGAEPADQTINDLQAQGYVVKINWVGGYSNESLSQCSVKGIHNPDGPPTSLQPIEIVYVDISCPGHFD
jgi:hypothetical protein